MRNTKALPLVDMGIFYAKKICPNMSEETGSKVHEVVYNFLYKKTG